jgi:DNA-directed RNA polymerase subunit RPC12/RpoP
MSEPRFRNDVLNPCPTCGKRFDTGGCMTFVDSFLEELHGGNCPACGTKVVVRVPEQFQPEKWDEATTLPEIRAIRIDELELSVRTRNSLAALEIETVGDLLNLTEARIRQRFAVSDSVIAEVRQLLASKGLAVPEN